jgi:undecaprenyl-diphosphatase
VALWLGVGYLALPFDLVPDFIPVVGALDDALVVGLVLRYALGTAGPGLVEEHWPGPPESLRALLTLAGGPPRTSFAWLRTLALGVALPLTVFALLAEDVWEKETIDWDKAILDFMRDHRTAWMTALMKGISILGSAPVVIAALALLVAGLIVAHRRRDALFAALAAGGAMALSPLLKNVFDRPRPEALLRLTGVGSYSFPSGHTMSSAGLAATVIVLAWPTRRRWPVTVVALVYTLAVGVSRVYLGVHFPSDVVAGWAVVIAWVAAVRLAFDWRAHRAAARREAE